MALPEAGGVGEQDAWLMNGLDYVATLHQQLIGDIEKRRHREALKKAKEQRQR